jgi:hypothetical protein
LESLKRGISPLEKAHSNGLGELVTMVNNIPYVWVLLKIIRGDIRK